MSIFLSQDHGRGAGHWRGVKAQGSIPGNQRAVRPLEDENRIPYPNLVAMGQHTLADRDSTDERIVAALQVLKEEGVGFFSNHTVVAGNQRIEQRDVVGWVAANRGRVFRERKQLSLKGSADSFQPWAGQSGDLGCRIGHDATSIPARRSLDSPLTRIQF